jgi:hypothetical protein
MTKTITWRKCSLPICKLYPLEEDYWVIWLLLIIYMRTRCNQIVRSDCEDKITWCLGKLGFSVKSLYKSSKCLQIPVPFKFLWKTKLPHKIKVFLWLALKNKILTKDNLKKKGTGRAPGIVSFVVCPKLSSILPVFGCSFCLEDYPSGPGSAVHPEKN